MGEKFAHKEDGAGVTARDTGVHKQTLCQKGIEKNMRHGFVKVAVGTPAIHLADCEYNAERIYELAERAEADGAKLLVLPELCITGYSCGDLFLQDSLLRAAGQALLSLAARTEGMDVLLVVGAPLEHAGKIYNAAVCVQNGRILGASVKTKLPNYGECAELRYFAVPEAEDTQVLLGEEKVPFGTGLLFCPKEIPGFRLGIEICEELWVPDAPSAGLALAGATVIANPSAGAVFAGKQDERRDKVKAQSLQLKAAYLYANAGEGESTTDLVYSGQGFVAESGTLLAEGVPFETEYFSTEIDIEKLCNERRQMSTWHVRKEGYREVWYSVPGLAGKELPEVQLSRRISPSPFFPEQAEKRNRFCRETLEVQCAGLKQRLKHINAKKVVIGISGGLDSTMALLVAAKTFEQMGLEPGGIVAVTMPCFGTTDRTYQNALKLVRELGAELREIRINDAVIRHFCDIGHDINNKNAAYENAQARERTQVLMDIANDVNGIVIGTGDLSELALGWATYNGDHMSMYGVNASIPKTLMRHLVAEFAAQCGSEALAKTLQDILDTPISPELLPPEEGKITQKTEDLVGPYELHDFFLYYVVNYGFSPSKIYRLAKEAFADSFDEATILAWLKVFYRRFFSQQYKRSCLPDGPKATVVSLSPRAAWRMPSDAHAVAWLNELEEIRM